jgi:UDP-glucose 4-epimerase
VRIARYIDVVETVLVTGGAGFIGSHVCDLARERGYAVIAIDDLSKGRRENLCEDADLRIVDIADRSAMETLGRAIGAVDAVIHCAAQASVVVSTEDPARDLLVNVAGTINVLEFCASKRCPMVFTSTGGAIYGEDAPRPTPETQATEPGAPYGASKAAAEIYIRQWARRDHLPHAILRLGNVYGPRQRGDGEAGVVAIFAERLRDGQPITLYGHGTPTRDYVHVSDVAKALLAAIGTTGTFNVATGVETSVRVVYDLAVSAFDRSVVDDPTLADLRPGEISASCLDVGRARDALAWAPSVPVAAGIPATVRALIA